MGYRVFNFSVAGASHIKNNIVCQDSSLSDSNERYSMAVVCDGHGGKDYIRSDIGSKLACEVVRRNIEAFSNDFDENFFWEDPENRVIMLEKSIIMNWNEAIREHYTTNPLNPFELENLSDRLKRRVLEEDRISSLYGTTLLAVVIISHTCFGIHVGDGECVFFNSDETITKPIPWDDKCFLNSTTSLCDIDAVENFRHYYTRDIPVAVFVGSDGIDGSFNNEGKLFNFYRAVLYSFSSTDYEQACSELEEYLPRMSRGGSGDDVSVAAIINLESAIQSSFVNDYSLEEEKARIVENKRNEAEQKAEERRRIEKELSDRTEQVPEKNLDGEIVELSSGDWKIENDGESRAISSDIDVSAVVNEKLETEETKSVSVMASESTSSQVMTDCIDDTIDVGLDKEE